MAAVYLSMIVATCSARRNSVTVIPCTSNIRTALFPSEVRVNLAAARAASATLRPARDNGGVCGPESFNGALSGVNCWTVGLSGGLLSGIASVASTRPVTAMPCTSNVRIAPLPSEVGVNLAAASLASAMFRPARVNGGGQASTVYPSSVCSVNGLRVAAPPQKGQLLPIGLTACSSISQFLQPERASQVDRRFCLSTSALLDCVIRRTSRCPLVKE